MSSQLFLQVFKNFQKIFGFPDPNRNRTETENVGSVIGLTEPIDILNFIMLSPLQPKFRVSRAEKSTADLLGKFQNPKFVRNETRLLLLHAQ